MKKLTALLLSMVFLFSMSIASAETIEEVFPDKGFAQFIRDQIGAISIHDEITQDKSENLKKITAIFWNDFYDYDIRDLTGIDKLSELKYLSVFKLNYPTDPQIASIPASIGKCVALKSLTLQDCPNLTSIPDELCNLVNLEDLDFSGSAIEALPENIGKLVNLKSIDISNTKIASLPENIGDLVNLKYIDISNTNITSLPESIRNLTNLETFRRAGLELE